MEGKFLATLEKFGNTDPVELANEPINEKLEMGLNIASGISGVILDAGAYKLLHEVVKPVIENEHRIPIKILYKASTFAVSAVISNSVRNYVSSIFTMAKTGIKAKQIIDRITKEEENGDDTEQVLES